MLLFGWGFLSVFCSWFPLLVSFMKRRSTKGFWPMTPVRLPTLFIWRLAHFCLTYNLLSFSEFPFFWLICSWTVLFPLLFSISESTYLLVEHMLPMAFQAEGRQCYLVSSFRTHKSFSTGQFSVIYFPSPHSYQTLPGLKCTCTWLCWTSLGSQRSTSQACPGPFEWHHSFWCLQTCWGYTLS